MSNTHYSVQQPSAPYPEAHLLYVSVSRYGVDWKSIPHTHYFTELSVPAKWILTARQYVLNIYTENRAYARPFKTGFG